MAAAGCDAASRRAAHARPAGDATWSDPALPDPEAGTDHGELAVWSRDGRRIPLAVRHTGGGEQLAWSRDERWLASWGADHEVRLSDLARGTELGSVAMPTERVALLW